MFYGVGVITGKLAGVLIAHVRGRKWKGPAPLSSDRMPFCNRRDSNVVKPLSDTNGVKRGRSVHRRTRRQRRGSVGSRNKNESRNSHANSLHLGRAAYSRSRGVVAGGRGAYRHSLLRQDDGNAGFEYFTN